MFIITVSLIWMHFTLMFVSMFRIKFKDFLALKGCRWAYNDDISLSGNLMVLAELKKQGYNANFFGHVVKSGNVIFNFVVA